MVSIYSDFEHLLHLIKEILDATHVLTPVELKCPHIFLIINFIKRVSVCRWLITEL